MELYFEACKKLELTDNFMEIPTDYDEFNVGDLEAEFDKFLKGENI